MQHFTKRLTLLWRAGYVSRFDAGTSRYLHGSRPFLYTIESGKAAGAARTGLRPEAVPEETWRTILRDAAPVRARVREGLLACGFALPEIDLALHNNTELALKHYVGDPSGVRHHVLAADCLSRVWYEARMAGHVVEDIKPDGIADLSAPEPEPRRYRDLVNSAGVIVIKPDCLFTIAGTRYALEAETGATSIAALRLKLRRYQRAMERDRETGASALRVLVHCHTPSHARTAHDILAVLGERSNARFIVSQGDPAATHPN